MAKLQPDIERLFGAGLLLLMVFTLAACAGGAAPLLPGTGANPVEVRLEEFTVNMPASIPAGATVFEVSNVGTEEHGFEIEGQGIEAGLERHLQPGETATLEVDLAEGSYEVYCPVEDHREEGMRLELTVTAP